MKSTLKKGIGFYLFWFCSAVASGQLTAMVAMAYDNPQSAVESFWFRLAFVMTIFAICGCGITLPSAMKPPNEPQKPKPRVRVWERNNVAAISAELDYQNWWQEYHRRKLAGLVPPNDAMGRPAPRLTAFFSDRPELAPKYYLAGTMKDFATLLSGCQREHSELFVPASESEWWFQFEKLSLAAIWRLVHGPDAKPPEPEKTA